MPRRLFTIFLAGCLMLMASGCSVMLNKEYLVISNYEDESLGDTENGETVIRDYNGLKNALSRQISGHEEHVKLKFNSYPDDVDVHLRQACDEARSDTPLASYVVDYISYDLNRIVAYYEADIYVSYKHTQEEVDQIVPLTSTYLLRDHIESALDDMLSTIVVRLSTSSVTKDTIPEYISEYYMQNPMSLVRWPEVEVNEYTGSGIQKIFEVLIDYGENTETLSGMKRDVFEAVDEITDEIIQAKPQQNQGEKALEAFRQIAAICEYDPDSTLRLGVTGADSGDGSTAYGVFEDGMADSCGFAMAYKALCDMLGIECMIVTGYFDKHDHYWNIIKLEDHYYHVDVSLHAENGEESCFMISDEQMWGRYVWESDDYPECAGPLNIYSIEPPALPADGAGNVSKGLDIATSFSYNNLRGLE